MTATDIRVGTASWSDHEPFYPPEYAKAAMKAQRIAYYARYFSLVEVDATFYHLLPQRNFAQWAERTPSGFVFDVKAYGELTWHHRDDTNTPITPSTDTFARFAEMIQPLREAGKLGAILFQFPPWFTFDEERREYLTTVRELLPDDTIAVEFRHRSWLEPDHLDTTRAALEDAGLAYCIVDEPQIGSGSVPPTALVTNPAFSMVRFHGRNRHNWYGRNLASSRERFDYLYSPVELAPWAERVTALAARLRENGAVHVVTNNNARNYGVLNALDLQTLLGQRAATGDDLPEALAAGWREHWRPSDAEPPPPPPDEPTQVEGADGH